MITELLTRLLLHLRNARRARRWEQLKRAGLRVGEGTALPATLWIDSSCPYAIEIGRHVGIGPDVLILAHDAQMRRTLGVTRVAPVRIGDGCRIGARTVILPGVEIGAGTIVFAGSVVSRSLPADSVCGGSPARPINSIPQYLASHREQLAVAPSFAYAEYGKHGWSNSRVRELQQALDKGPIYLIGADGVRAPESPPSQPSNQASELAAPPHVVT